MDVLSVGMLNRDGPNADLHLRSDRAVIIIMSKRRDQFRPYQHVDPGGRPVKTCELCGERPASRYTPFTKPDRKTGRMRTCGECADAMPVTKDAETGEWVVDIDLDA
jgi:hypothetical protein